VAQTCSFDNDALEDNCAERLVRQRVEVFDEQIFGHFDEAVEVGPSFLAVSK